MGAVLITALICLLVTSILVDAMLRSSLLNSRQVVDRQHHVQACWLAESGIETAVFSLTEDKSYSGETWTIAASELQRPYDGRVEIGIHAGENGVREIRVHARCPADGPEFSGVSKRIVIGHLDSLNLEKGR